jgi:hypothetical protein
MCIFALTLKHGYTLDKLKTIGHGEEVYKRLLGKSKEETE